VSVSTNSRGDFSAAGLLYVYKDLVELYSIVPAIDVDAGGSNITITGSAFKPTADLACRFGTIMVPAQYLSSRTIVCQAPTHHPGLIKVVVTLNGVDFSVSELAFWYIPRLLISSVEPAIVQVGSVVSLTVNGSYFDHAILGGLGLSCNISGILSSAAVLSSRSLKCRLPNIPEPGVFTVGISSGVRDLSGSSLQVTVYRAPSLLSVQPSHGSAHGGTTVTIHGTNFVADHLLFCHFHSSVVDFTAVVPATTSNDNLTVSCITPPTSETELQVLISVTAGDSMGIMDEKKGLPYLYRAPLKLKSISPRVGDVNGGTSVSIRTANGSSVFESNTLGCRFGESDTVAATILGENLISCVSPVGHMGAVTVEVTENGVDFTGSGLSFTYLPAPTISNIYPTSGPTNGGTRVIIDGTGFTQDAAVCRFAGVVVPANVTSPTQAICLTPGAIDAMSVVVAYSNNHAEYVVSPSNFSFYLQPQVSSVSPESGTVNGSSIIHLGTMTPLGTDDAHIMCQKGTVGAASIAVVKDGYIECTVDCDKVENTFIRVSLNGGVDYGKDHVAWYCDPLPHVERVVPSSGSVSGGTTVIITGTGFINRNALSCRFGSQHVPALWISEGQISCVTPTHSVDSVMVEITTDGRHFSSWDAGARYTYTQQETITDVRPRYVSQRGGSMVKVTGTNFLNSSAVTCRVGSSTRSKATYVSSTEVLCMIPSMESHGEMMISVANNGHDFSFHNGASIVIEEVPGVIALVPEKGLRSGGALVTIIGKVSRSGLGKPNAAS